MGEATNHSCAGVVESVENVNDEIVKLVLNADGNETIMYKYKNMLGEYYQAEVPKEKTFDLIIPTPTDNWTGSYPNAGYVFDKEGNYHSCLDYTNCTDTETEYSGIFYK